MLNPMNLEGRTIVITGAAQGIGKAVADLSYELGSALVLIDANGSALADAAAGYSPDRCVYYAGSVSDSQFIGDALKSAQEKMGPLHGIVNSAGIVRAAMLEKMTDAQWKDVIDVNLTGAYYCVQAFGRLALEDTEVPRSIVNVSSIAGRSGTIGQINYSAAKSGLFGITLSTAKEWTAKNIRSNAVCFGLVETPMTETVRGEKFREKVLERIPMGRWASVDEAATPICFLLSNASSYITGQVLSVDGGSYLSS